MNRKRIVAIIANTSSNPLKKLRKQMTQEGRVVNVALGKPVRSYVLTDTNQLFLTHVDAKTLKVRVNERKKRKLHGNKKRQAPPRAKVPKASINGNTIIKTIENNRV